MKKRGLWILSLIIITLFSAVLVSAISYSAPHITATLMSQDPDPVEPGQIVTVKLKIENDGTETTKDVIVKLLPKFPFTLYGTPAEKNLGKLRASSTGADAEIVEFNLKVDESAVEENTELELEIIIGDTAISYTNNEIMINIQTHDAVLAITSITSEPQSIAPGGTAKVTIMVKNTADSLLKDIKFKLDMSSNTLPLAPYQSSSERRISQLQTNYQQTMTFNLIAEPDAVSGLYKIPLNISYSDEQGTDYTQTDTLAMLIGEIPKISLYLKKSTVMSTKSVGKITLEVANAGSTDIKFVELTLKPSEDYQLVTSHDYFYLGNIASDDTQSEEIDIYLNKDFGKDGKAKIPVHLKYADANNKIYQQDSELELNLYSSSELKKFGLVQASSGWIYVLILILVIAGFFVYKKYGKEKIFGWFKNKNKPGK